MTAATLIPTAEFEALRERVRLLDWIEHSARTNADGAVIVTWINDGQWSYMHGNPAPELESESARLLAELTRYQRAHKSTCPGCELCLPGSDYARNRARPELDLDCDGRPMRAGT